MSRSVLRNKWVRDYIDKKSRKKYSGLKPTSNPHKFDEMPKNHTSKYIKTRCPNAEWLQEPSNFCGHKPHSNGHRMVSGIVRAKVKEEVRDEINRHQEEINYLMEETSFEDYCGSCDKFQTDECPNINKVDNYTKWKDINCEEFWD